MKALLAILSLVFFATTSHAGDFPTGTFNCKGQDYGKDTEITVIVSEVKLGDDSLPLVDLQLSTRQWHIKGIASLQKGISSKVIDSRYPSTVFLNLPSYEKYIIGFRDGNLESISEFSITHCSKQ